MSNQPLDPTQAPVTDATPNTANNSSLNAIKHGACAVSTLILATESHDDYLLLERKIVGGYGLPTGRDQNPVEAGLIRAVARAEWIYLRSERNYTEAEAGIMNQIPDVLAWTEDHHRSLARFLRYRTANHNLLLKARKAVEDFRKAREHERILAVKLHNDHQRLAMSKDRLDVYREKNKPWDFEAELEEMREKSIRLGFLNPDGTPGPRKY